MKQVGFLSFFQRRLPCMGASVLAVAAFQCVVPGTLIAAEGAAVKESIRPPQVPVILEDPKSVTVAQGEDATFQVKATGSKRFRYDWYLNGKLQSGVNDKSVKLPNVKHCDDGAKLYVVVSNRAGKATSKEAVLTVKKNTHSPIINTFKASPENIKKGGVATLEAFFTGGAGVVTPGNFPIASGKALEVRPNATTVYTLTVTASCGMKTTAKVKVVVGNSAPAPSDKIALKLGRCLHSATLMPSGRILLVGGLDSLGKRAATASAELIDPSNGTSASFGNLKHARAAHTATLLRDGTVFIAGGVCNANILERSVEIYDSSTGKVQHVTMGHGRAYHSVTMLEDGDLLIAGGSRDAEIPAEIFCTISKKFTPIAKTQAIRFAHTATTLPDGRVLLAGGMTAKNGASALAEIYDPASRTFRATGSMNVARYIHAAVLLLDGKVLITGGFNGKKGIESAEIYDPATGRFTEVQGGMLYPRSGHTATLVGKKVLLVGSASSSEIYDPSKGRFVEGPAVDLRSNHTATLLNDGRVVVAGGQVSQKVLANAEYVTLDSEPGPDPDPDPDPEPDPDEDQAPVITANPAPQTASEGSSVTFSVVADGKNINYQWIRDSKYIKGANSSSYTMKSVSLDDDGAQFAVQVTNDVGVATSKSALLTVIASNKKPTIASFTANPSKIKSGKQAKLLAEFINGEGVITPGYTPIESGVPFSVKPLETTTYTLTVTGENGQSVTSTATITVGDAGETPAVGAFSLAGKMRVERVGHTSTRLQNGRVLLVGGSRTDDLNNVLSMTEFYDPANGNCYATGSMAKGRRGHTATLLNDGRVLVTGGANGTENYATAELFNPTKGTFVKTGEMNSSRCFHTASLLPDGSVLIVGGAEGAEIYNPKNGKFFKIGDPSVARMKHTAVELPGGRILLAGGHDLANTVLFTAEVYDPANKTFTKVGNLREGRQEHCAVLLENGKVLLAGGLDEDEALATAEIFDPAKNTFVKCGKMACVRSQSTATPLNDGRVLITGFGNYAELFNPADNTFSFAGNMQNARARHTSTLLSDGRVLLSGGAFDGGALATLEVYKITE